LAIAVDGADSAYVTGFDGSDNFPTTPGAFQTSRAGTMNAFVTKFRADGSVVYSTYLGGSDSSNGRGIAVDQSGNAYITGQTCCQGAFPTTAGTFKTTSDSPFADAFVSKLNVTGSGLVYSTFLGGSGDLSIGNGIVVDSSGSAFVTGSTASSNFPTAAALQPFGGGVCMAGKGSRTCMDTFVTKLSPDGSTLAFSTFLGGSRDDLGNGLAVDSSGNILVTGETFSPEFPMKNAADSSFLIGEAFVTKISIAPPDFGLTASPASATVTRGQTASYTVTVASQSGFTGSVNLACSGLPAGASCTFTPNPLPGTGDSALKISTTAASASLSFPKSRRPEAPIFALWTFTSWGLMGVTFVSKNSRNKRLAIFLGLLVLALMLFQVACGGGNNSAKSPGGSGPPSSSGTPVGTYSIVVSGTSGSLQHTATVQLVVQ